MNQNVVIIDAGSGVCKAGVASQANPELVSDTVVGYEFRQNVTGVPEKRYFGEEAYKSIMIALSYPIVRGIIADFDKMEEMLTDIFEKLSVKPEESIILLTESLFNPKENREKITEIIFENFNASGFYLSNDAVLALLATGRSTGVVLQSGHGITHSVTVHEGNVVSDSLRQMDIAGVDINDYLIQLLNGRSFNKISTRDRIDINYIKANLCEVSPSTQMPDVSASKFILPGGKSYEIGYEKYQCVEILFEPRHLGQHSMMGIDKMVNYSIMNSDITIRQQLYSNIVLAGGTTKTRGIIKRLKGGIESLMTDNMELNIVGFDDAQYLSWKGGVKVSHEDSFKQLFIKKHEYDTIGKGVVNRKC